MREKEGDEEGKVKRNSKVVKKRGREKKTERIREKREGMTISFW